MGGRKGPPGRGGNTEDGHRPCFNLMELFFLIFKMVENKLYLTVLFYGLNVKY